MLLSEEDVELRLASPLNLINRMKQSAGMDVFVGMHHRKENDSNPAVVTALPPSIDDLVENVTSKVKLNAVQEQALDLMHDSMGRLKLRMDEIDKPEKFAAVAHQMNNILNSIDEAKHERGSAKQQVIIYKPVINNENHYETLSLND